MKKLLPLLLALLLAGTQAQAQFTQTAIDALGGHKGLISEFFFLKPIDQANHWLVVSRSELHLPDYNSAHPEFLNFNTLSYNLKNSLGWGVGTYASDHYRFSLRTGPQFFRESEHGLIYAFLSTAVTKDPDAQLLLIGSYTPELSEHWKLFTRAELRTAINYNRGHAFSNQLLRLGVQRGRVAFGAGAELEEQGRGSLEEEPHHTYFNIGPFVRLILE